MPLAYLVFTVNFYNCVYHGKTQHKASEWPPPWFRLYNAIVDSLTRLEDPEYAITITDMSQAKWDMEKHRPYFSVLERLGPPQIVAARPAGKTVSCTEYVPNNDLDIHGGSKEQVSYNHRKLQYSRTAMEVVHTPLPVDKALRSVQYVFAFDTEDGVPADFMNWLHRACMAISVVGTGRDSATCRASLLTDYTPALSDKMLLWLPYKAPAEAFAKNSGTPIHRIPTAGCTDQLEEIALRRKSGGSRGEAQAVKNFIYHPSDVRLPQPWAVFKLNRLDDEDLFAEFHVTDAYHVSHAVALAAHKTWTRELMPDDDNLILGHLGCKIADYEGPPVQRMSFLPLPTVDMYKVRAIRRIMVTAPFGREKEVAWAADALDGKVVNLTIAGRERGFRLTHVCDHRSPRIPKDHSLVRRFIGPFSSWDSVTPVMFRNWPSTKPEPGDTPQYNRCHRFREALVEAARNACSDGGFPPDSVLQMGVETGFAKFKGVMAPQVFRCWPENRYKGQMLAFMSMTLKSPVIGPVTVGCSPHMTGMGLMVGNIASDK